MMGQAGGMDHRTIGAVPWEVAGFLLTQYSMKLFVSLLIPAFALGSAVQAQAQVTGKVTDAYTNDPIAQATVADQSSGLKVSTDRNGQFSLACTGSVTLTITRSGYAPAQRTVSDCPASVQVQLIPSAQSLSAVNVAATSDRATISQPQAVTTLSTQQLQRGSGLILQDAMNLTPGVDMERRTMGGGQRIKIRGYSDGRDAGNFAGTGFKAYLNGIPITNAEGLTILDDVDFANLGRVDVVRGPASTIYGAGIGGVVNMYTAEPTVSGTNIVQATSVGSDGLLRSDTKLENSSDAASTILDYGHQKYDSYRVHSASRKDYASFLGEFRPSDKRTISTYLQYANSRDERAGEMDSVSFSQKLNQGEDRYINNDARQGIEGFRTGVTHNYQFNDMLRNVSTVFLTGHSLEDVYAAGINSKQEQNFGARTTFNTDFANLAIPLHGVTGGEFQKTNGFAKGYGMSNSVLGALRSDIETHSMQSTIFTQWTASLPQQFALTAGASANFIQYDIVDRMANSANPTHMDGSGRKVFDAVVTPRVALTKMFGPNMSVYANVSQGYTPPTSSDAIIPFTGEPNAGLKPERATQYEIGTKGNVLQGRLSYELSLFDSEITNKLGSQAVFDTDGTVLYSFTVNAGDQSDQGVEASVAYSLIDDPSQFVSSVRPFANYTYSNFTYNDFKSTNNDTPTTVDYTDNYVVGVAPHVFNLGLDAGLRSGAYGNVTYHHTEGMPISYDNAHWAPGFSLLDAKIGFAHDLANGFKFDAYFGGQNLGNSLYYTQVFLNHKFDSPTPPNMYLPGPYTAKFYGGLKLSYAL
jgi:iron complex outermembrane receptor protein